MQMHKRPRGTICLHKEMSSVNGNPSIITPGIEQSLAGKRPSVINSGLVNWLVELNK